MQHDSQIGCASTERGKTERGQPMRTVAVHEALAESGAKEDSAEK